MMTEKYICPVCQQKTGVVILYGFPDDDMFEMVRRGEMALGGCCVDRTCDPERRCANCGHEWRVTPKGVRFEPQ